MKILANDGISNSGVKKLEESGFEVITTNVAQEQLENYINEMKFQEYLLEVLPLSEKSLLTILQA